jgi:hypothetical protein
MFASCAEASGLVRAEQTRTLTMFAKTTHTLIAAIIAVSATLAVSTVQAGPLQAPTAAEKLWMDRASGPAEGN